MPRLKIVFLLSLSIRPLLAQEVSQSGLTLQAPRAIIALPERAPSAMAATVHPLATEAALDIMRKGGNAIDAAVAIAFVLAVVHPEAGNIAGGGFLMAHLAGGKTVVVDYAFQTPQAFRPQIFAGEKITTVGYKTIGIPGTAAGMGLAHAKYGKLKWADCLEPARRLAKAGFPASQRIEMILRLQVPVMKNYPETARIFLNGSDKPLKQGDLIVQKDLAETIARMQKRGWREFYTGETAQRMLAGFKANGGVITAADLEKYEALEREPLRITYRGHPVLVTPPYSSGGTVLAVSLNTIEQFELKLGMEGSSLARHLQVEAMRTGSQAGRLLTQGKQAAPQLISKEFAREAARSISLDRAGSATLPASNEGESNDTTHYTVADSLGNIVTNTYTLNGFYGSQVIPKGTGLLMNNYMSPQRTVKGGDRVYSNMTPAVVLRPDGTPWAAFGSPGSATIPSTVMQIVINLVDFKMGLRDAIEYPRIHFGGTAGIDAEPGALVFDVAGKLRLMGHRIGRSLRSQGDVNAIAIEEKTAWKQGWADGRRGGAVKGY
ncbi:MAG: gamma-glutamyltransferase [Bryobacteraceae bacterium]